MGRIFAYWAIVYFLKIIEVDQIFGATFFSTLSFVLILTKKAWATSRAIFSQTHLVTQLAWPFFFSKERKGLKVHVYYCRAQ
jgi:hypothetical protein